jgi:Transposase DDE domain
VKKSVSQEHLLFQVEIAVRDVLIRAATELARPTGLIQRQGKVTGANLAQTLVFGWLSNPASSLDELAQFGSDVGLDITGQGLDDRFTQRAVRFFQALFHVALGEVVVADPVALPLLERFTAVELEDSSVVPLPDELATLFRGCGGHKDGEGTKSSFKIFARLDMLRGGLACSELQEGRYADAKSPLREARPAGTLSIRDRGFVDVSGWQEEVEQGCEILSYYKTGIKLFEADGRPINLVKKLQGMKARGEFEVLVSQQQKFPMRLLFERVPKEVADERKRSLQREAKTHGRTCSEDALELANWTLALTTVAPARLSLVEALVLLRLRWQIELLFKLWKSHGQLDEWRSEKPERILCEIYAKLIGLLIQHWMLVVSCWHEPHRSLVKAAKAVRKHAIMLVATLLGPRDFHGTLQLIQRAAAGSRLNSREDAPNTSQLVKTRRNDYSSRPIKRKVLR